MTQRYEVVYSSDEFCSRCRSAPCRCGKKRVNAQPGSVAQSGAPQKGGPKMRLETSGRKGKAVTVLFNLGLPENALRDLLKELQKACGTGGTVGAGGIEIQGDHRDRVEALLRERGIMLKRAGG